MSKITENKRKEIIERIMRDIEANYGNYQEFVLDCVRDRVENWEDDELLNWIGEKND